MPKRLIAALGTLLIAGCGLAPNAALPSSTVSARLAARSAATRISAVNFAQVTDPKDPGLLLYRGGLPSDDDLKSLVTLGIKTDVNLLDPKSSDGPVIAHEQVVCNQLGLKMINIPLPWGQQPPMAMVDTFLTAARASGVGNGVYVHCTHGRDRTGTMVACYRIEYDGYTAQQALTEMESFGYNPTVYPWMTQFIESFASQHAH